MWVMEDQPLSEERKQSIRRGVEQAKAGDVRPATDVLADLGLGRDQSG